MILREKKKTPKPQFVSFISFHIQIKWMQVEYHLSKLVKYYHKSCITLNLVINSCLNRSICIMLIIIYFLILTLFLDVILYPVCVYYWRKENNIRDVYQMACNSCVNKNFFFVSEKHVNVIEKKNYICKKK